MAERDQEKQSSVLFSLRELMSLEEERIQTEKQREEEARAAERRAKMEAELRLRAAEEARIRAEDERRALEAAREREEAARLEAIQRAAIERARLEAEEKARLAQLELSHKHERDLHALRADKEKMGLRRALVVVAVGAFVLAGGGLGYYFGLVLPEAERERIAAEQKAQALQAQRDAAERDAAERKKQIDDLTAQRDKAVSEKERAELDAQLAKLRGDAPSAKPTPVGRPGAGSGTRTGPTNTDPALDACKNSNDPMCGM